MIIEDNTFKDNDDGLVFYKEQELPRATLFMAKGGLDYSIDKNTISYDASTYYSRAFKTIESYYNWLPRDYWTSLKSPLFRLDLPDGKAVSFD